MHRLTALLLFAVLFWGLFPQGGFYHVFSRYRPSESALPTKARSTEPALAAVNVDRDGHYRVAVRLPLGTVDMLIDTGATYVVLSYEDASYLGMRFAKKDFNMRVLTANGATVVAPVIFPEMRVGDVYIRGVQAVVARPGALSDSLLGMSFLGRIDSFEVRNNQFIMTDYPDTELSSALPL